MADTSICDRIRAGIAQILAWHHWPALGHFATAIAALAAVLGVTVTSCDSRDQLQLTQNQLELTESQLELSENANRTNWGCQFLYHQEESLSALLRDTGSIISQVSLHVAKSTPVMFEPDSRKANYTLQKVPQKLGEISGQPETILPTLDEFQGLVSSSTYLFRPESMSSIFALSARITRITAPQQAAATPLDLQKAYNHMSSIHKKIRSELTCARTALRDTCDPESAANAAPPSPASWCAN